MILGIILFLAERSSHPFSLVTKRVKRPLFRFTGARKKERKGRDQRFPLFFFRQLKIGGEEEDTPTFPLFYPQRKEIFKLFLNREGKKWRGK